MRTQVLSFIFFPSTKLSAISEALLGEELNKQKRRILLTWLLRWAAIYLYYRNGAITRVPSSRSGVMTRVFTYSWVNAVQEKEGPTTEHASRTTSCIHTWQICISWKAISLQVKRKRCVLLTGGPLCRLVSESSTASFSVSVYF